jgi:hypothetical protein
VQWSTRSVVSPPRKVRTWCVLSWISTQLFTSIRTPPTAPFSRVCLTLKVYCEHGPTWADWTVSSRRASSDPPEFVRAPSLCAFTLSVGDGEALHCELIEDLSKSFTQGGGFLPKRRRVPPEELSVGSSRLRSNFYQALSCARPWDVVPVSSRLAMSSRFDWHDACDPAFQLSHIIAVSPAQALLLPRLS